MTETKARTNATGRTDEDRKAIRREIERRNNARKQILYDRIALAVTKQSYFKDRAEAAAIERGISVNQYIIEATEKMLIKDGYTIEEAKRLREEREAKA